VTADQRDLRWRLLNSLFGEPKPLTKDTAERLSGNTIGEAVMSTDNAFGAAAVTNVENIAKETVNFLQDIALSQRTRTEMLSAVISQMSERFSEAVQEIRTLNGQVSGLFKQVSDLEAREAELTRKLEIVTEQRDLLSNTFTGLADSIRFVSQTIATESRRTEDAISSTAKTLSQITVADVVNQSGNPIVTAISNLTNSVRAPASAVMPMTEEEQVAAASSWVAAIENHETDASMVIVNETVETQTEVVEESAADPQEFNFMSTHR
jgi:chromosome segregation ATPase